MALDDKILAFEQLAAAKADIYDPTASTKANIHNILIHNINTTTENVQLLYHDGTNEYFLFNMGLEANESVMLEWLGEGFIVEAAGKITGNADTASKVTIKIDGTEES